MRIMKTSKLLFLAIVVATAAYLASCGSDDEKPQTAPTVATNETIISTTTTATVTGEIKDDGNASVTEAGFVYSSNVAEPTTADNKKTITDFEEFTAELEGLTSGTIYNVRAYAINKKGTGYGETRTFETGNLAPVASDVLVTGTFEVSKTLTATYTYADAEGDDEDVAGTMFQWYAANDGTGSNETAIEGATSKTFVVQDAQNGKFLRVAVTPKAIEGTLIGAEVKSTFTTEIGAETVTFMYNGTTVTYGTIIGPSGKKWLDRNLGAGRIAQSVNDYQAYGDLFQWGRAADGHQLVTRTGVNNEDATGVTGITSTDEPYETSSDDTPETNKFIIIPGTPGDWRDPQNDNLWQGVNGINNPCPAGWRVPTKDEWIAENLGSSTNAFEKLKLTYTGFRFKNDGTFRSSTFGFYKSTTINPDFPSEGVSVFQLYFDATTLGIGYTNRGTGGAVRCIKN